MKVSKNRRAIPNGCKRCWGTDAMGALQNNQMSIL